MTPALTKRIVKYIRDGNTRRLCAAAAGIDTDTFQEWIRWGKNGDPVYKDFSEQVLAADLAVESEQVRKMTKATKTTEWRAAQAWLGYRRHQDWGDVTKLEVKISGEMDLSVLSPEELSRVAELLAKAHKKEDE